MGDLRRMRASDREREQVVARLRGALEEGRLTLDEYMSRMEAACQAVTHGELAPLYADLPAGDAQPAAPSVPASLAGFAGLPTTLKVLWTIWLVAVSVNAVTWILVSVIGERLAYPWPLWVAGPYGAVLFALSLAAGSFRRARPAAPATPPAAL